jgi:hypothetical protein
MIRLDVKANNIGFHIHEGDLHEVVNEDGVGTYPISWVVASFDEHMYFYPHHFLAKFVEVEVEDEVEDDFVFLNSRDLCDMFISKVSDFGSINLSKWSLFIEEEFDLESDLNHQYQIEQSERY